VFTDWAQAKQWVQLGRKLCPASEQEFSVHSLHVKHIYRQSKLVTATGTPFHVLVGETSKTFPFFAKLRSSKALTQQKCYAL